MQSLPELEQLCNVLYNGHDPSERAHAENSLRPFSVNVDYIPQCKAILDSATSPYAQLFATSSLTKLLTDNAGLSGQLKIDMRNYVINYLATKGTALEGFVVTAQVQLLSRITKTAWLDTDNEAHREIVTEVMNFLKQNNKIGRAHV